MLVAMVETYEYVRREPQYTKESQMEKRYDDMRCF